MNPLSEPNVSKLLDTLFYSTDINTLIECAANILKNPISIYNTAFFCVGLSNKKGIDDDLWQQGAIGENIKYEYEKRKTSNENLQILQNRNISEHNKRLNM